MNHSLGGNEPSHWDVPTSVPVVIVSAIDPVLRDTAETGLMLDAGDGGVVLRYTVDVQTSVLRRLVVTAGGVLEDECVELDHPCVSCAMREDAVPSMNRLAAEYGAEAIILSPPISADPAVVAASLIPAQGRWHLSDAVCAVAAATAVHDILGEDTLAERELQWASEDERSVGEALAAQLEYSGLIVVDRYEQASGSEASGRQHVPAGRELIEHLRSPEQLLVEEIHSLDGRMTLNGSLDHAGGTRRRDPRYVEAWGGPTEHGTWTLDLHSKRPFHPRRLLENIELLGSGHLRGRGCFWVPDRPGTICQWDGAGGQVSVGAVMDAGRELPVTHLVVTGVDPQDMPRVRDAFGRCLLTEAEWEQGLAPWMDSEDLLAPWLGERSLVR